MFFFASMWQINPAVVNETDFLGLTSHFTAFYWLGFALITACTVKAYLDPKLNNSAIFVAILLALGLFLIGPRIFAEANPTPSHAYWVGAGYKDAISGQQIDFSSSRALDNYSAWPGFHLVTANLLSVTGVGYETLAKYMPLFWLVSCALITFATGKRLGLASKDCLLLCVLTIASCWVLQNYYSPQMLAFTQYLLLFMLITTFRNALTGILVTILAYLALVVTHGLTNAAVLLATLMLLIWLRKNRFALLFVTVFVVWIAYLSPLSLKMGLTTLRDQVLNLDLLAFLDATGYQAAPTIAGQIGKLSRFLYPAIYALLIGAALIICFARKTDTERGRRVLPCFAWMAGVLLLLPAGTGWSSEVDWRVYVYLLLPAAAVVVIILSGSLRGIMAVVMVLFISLHVPANYHTEASQQTFTSELRGAEFFARHVYANEPTYTSYGHSTERYIQFYDPAKLTYQWRAIKRTDQAKDRVQEATASVMEECELFITNDRAHNFLMYTYSFDPAQEWLESNAAHLMIFYDNGHYQIYRKSDPA